jgi:hypothetical protein
MDEERWCERGAKVAERDFEVETQLGRVQMTRMMPLFGGFHTGSTPLRFSAIQSTRLTLLTIINSLGESLPYRPLPVSTITA